jgi:HK97 family phage prohead protease
MITRNYKGEYTTDATKVTGYAVVFGQPTTISEPVNGRMKTFTEVVNRDSLHFDNLKLLWSHDTRNVLASTKSGTLRVSVDNKGLRFEADLPESAQREREALQRQDVDGCSFGFDVKRDKWDGNTRELLDVNVHEISICAFPAYPQTSVGVRNRYEMQIELAEKFI